MWRSRSLRLRAAEAPANSQVPTGYSTNGFLLGAFGAMTYCVGMLLDSGLVFLGDSRTHAGVDQVSTFRKVTIFERPGERVFVLMSSGNLAISQALLNVVREQIENAGEHSLYAVSNMFDAARCIGDALRVIHRRDGEALKEHSVEFNSSFIFGGQISGEPPRLFCIYAAGNFIEATSDTLYFQIGESKYGKPIIDRVVTRGTGLAEAAKCALISMDSTIRSNLTVGPPLDLVSVKSDALRIHSHVSIDEDHAYFQMVRKGWSESLRHAFQALPNPDWLNADQGQVK